MSDNLYVAKSDAALQAALNRFQIAVEDLAFIGTIPVEEAAGRAARQAIIDDVGGWRGNGDPRNRVVAYLPEPDPIDTIRTAVERIRAQLSAINEAMRLLKPLFGLMFLVWLGALWVGCHD